MVQPTKHSKIIKKLETPITIALIIFLTLSSVIVVYTYSWWMKENSKISIKSAEPYLGEDGRYIRLTVKSLGTQDVNLERATINGTIVSINKTFLKAGYEKDVAFQYYWLKEKTYNIKLETKQGTQSEITVKTPKIETSLDFTIINATRSLPKKDGTYQLTLEYRLNSIWNQWTYIGFYAYKSYSQSNIPVYVFYDRAYMANQTLQRADALLDLASKYGLNMSKIGWEGLKTLATFRPKCILILFNPLINATGIRYYDAAPSCLMDPNEDGYVKNHSRYSKSIVYDWEKDNNLIFVTVGSSQAPASWIIAKNGTVYRPKDSDLTDKFFADTPGAFRGVGYDTINPTRTGRTLGLHSWGSGWRLVPSMLDASIGPENYYVYGLNNMGGAQPCYVKVGTGGWLYGGDGWNLDDQTIANDLTMIMLHSPWNGEWLGSNSWDYDSGYKLYLTNGGAWIGKDDIQTGYMHDLKTANVTLRTLLLSYDGDNNNYFIYNEVKEYQKWWTEYGITVEATRLILKPDGRYIDFTAKALNQSVDIKDIYLNGSKASSSWTGGRHLEPGSSANISLNFHWLPGKDYVLKVETEQGSYDEKTLYAPEINSAAGLNATRIIVEKSLNKTRLTLDYNITSTGYSYLYTAFFAYKSYNETRGKIYIFYDPKYMPNITLRRIDVFLNVAKEYNLEVIRVDWATLKGLAEYRPNCTLIMFNPLMDSNGYLFYDAAPSSLLDANEDGYIKTESSYQKSPVYDWERDKGLVFISVGSDQAPSNWIIARNGTAYRPRDADFTDKFFADTSGAFRGMGYNLLSPTLAGQTLALHNWGSWWRLDATMLNDTHENYYVYGLVPGTSLAQPVFIQIGAGGWLYCGNGWNLNDEAVAHDLTMLLLHAPWRGKRLGAEPWNYDSASKLYVTNGGKMKVEDSFSTGWMNEDVKNFSLRIIFIAYDEDTGRSTTWETSISDG